MKNPLPLTDKDGEVRELTQDDFRKAVSFSELPESLQMILKQNQNKLKTSKINAKQQVSDVTMAY